MLRRAQDAEFRHNTGGAAPERPRKIEFGEIDGGVFGRLQTSYDQAGDDLSVLGVTIELGDNVSPELARAFRTAAASFLDAAEDQEEQAAAKETISALVAAIMQRIGSFADMVRQRKFQRRYGA